MLSLKALEHPWVVEGDPLAPYYDREYRRSYMGAPLRVLNEIKRRGELHPQGYVGTISPENILAWLTFVQNTYGTIVDVELEGTRHSEAQYKVTFNTIKLLRSSGYRTGNMELIQELDNEVERFVEAHTPDEYNYALSDSLYRLWWD